MKKKISFIALVVFIISVNLTTTISKSHNSKFGISTIFKTASADGESPDMSKACPNSSTKTCVVSSNGQNYTVDNKYSS